MHVALWVTAILALINIALAVIILRGGGNSDGDMWRLVGYPIGFVGIISFLVFIILFIVKLAR